MFLKLVSQYVPNMFLHLLPMCFQKSSSLLFQKCFPIFFQDHKLRIGVFITDGCVDFLDRLFTSLVNAWVSFLRYLRLLTTSYDYLRLLTTIYDDLRLLTTTYDYL